METLSYSIPGAAKAIGLSTSSIWRLIAAGELTTFKLWGKTLIEAPVLQELIRRHSQPSRP